jgi:hypothetical protein
LTARARAELLITAGLLTAWLLAAVPLFRAEAVTLGTYVPLMLDESREQRAEAVVGWLHRFTRAALAAVPEHSTIWLINPLGHPTNTWRINALAYPRQVSPIHDLATLDLTALGPDVHLMVRGDSGTVASVERAAEGVATLQAIYQARYDDKVLIVYRVVR